MGTVFVPTTQVHLSKGVDLRGLVGSLTMEPGTAQDCQDVLPREDLGIYKTFGWWRINDTALSGTPVALKGFTYRGKNNNAAGGNTVRGGNYGIADDGAIFTRRAEEFSGLIVLTDTTFYFWNATTETFDSVALPGGVSIDIDGKPSFVVFKENVYIVGYADSNLRFDPTDRKLYKWGWESLPIAPGASAAAGGNLLENVTYKYAYTYFDIYTGEETALGASQSVTTTSANKSVDLTFAAYSGSRHFNDLAIGTDSDVGIVVYRTGADDDTYHPVTTLNPGTLAYTDNDHASADFSLSPFQRTMQDEPRFYALIEFRGRLYGLSRKGGGSEFSSNRLYYSEIDQGFFVERWRVGGYLDLPVSEGNALTALGATDARILVHGRRGCFAVTDVPTSGGTPQHIQTKLPWVAGAVGPRARDLRDGWEYWISDRGPYRWQEGLSAPEFIGEPVGPLFVDPNSGTCRLSEAYRELAEVGFEWYSSTVRMIFPIGTSPRPNFHLAYWVHADRLNGNSSHGWFPQSPKMQCMDLSHSLDQLDENGKPITGSERMERLVWADADGYVYEYDIGSLRGGLRPGFVGKDFASVNGTASTVTTNGGLYTTGDGLKGLRIEVVAADGTSQVRTIESNTATVITVTEDFTTNPVAGNIIWIGGIPSFWRSWVDHFGDPQAHKTVLHVGFNYLKTGPSAETVHDDWKLDVGIAGGEFPTSFTRKREASLNQYRKRVIASMTAVFFTYEVANSRPDEPWVLTGLQREVVGLSERRRI